MLTRTTPDAGPRKVAAPRKMRKPWTNLRALAVAIQHTRSRAEAAALVATWRAPREDVEPLGVDFLDDETDEAMSPAEGARMVLEGIENARKAPARRRP